MRRFFLSIFDLLDIASPRSVSFAECPGGTRAYLAASTDGVFYDTHCAVAGNCIVGCCNRRARHE